MGDWSALDTVRTAPLEEFIFELRSCLEQGWNGFTGRVVTLL